MNGCIEGGWDGGLSNITLLRSRRLKGLGRVASCPQIRAGRWHQGRWRLTGKDVPGGRASSSQTPSSLGIELWRHSVE